jgi:hypothetical protein
MLTSPVYHRHAEFVAQAINQDADQIVMKSDMFITKTTLVQVGFYESQTDSGIDSQLGDMIIISKAKQSRDQTI